MICIYKYFSDTEQRKAIGKDGLPPADCAGDNDKHEQKKEKKKDIIEYSQEQPGTARQSPFPDEMKSSAIKGRKYPLSAAGITIAPPQPGPLLHRSSGLAS